MHQALIALSLPTGGGAWAASCLLRAAGWGGCGGVSTASFSLQGTRHDCFVCEMTTLSVSCLCFPSPVPLHSSLPVFRTDSQSICRGQVSLSRPPTGLSGPALATWAPVKAEPAGAEETQHSAGKRMGKANAVYYSSQFGLYLGGVSVQQQC